MPDITDKITQEYDASQIQVLEGLEAVRKRPGMYIGSTSSSGLHHLVYEIVDNSIDEALAGYCSHIELTIEPGDIICVSDNGRGIPVDIQPQTGKSALEVVFTVLHAGGKFGGGGYKVSGGLHGVGASVVNALSEWLEVNVHKNGKIYQMKFSRGDITQPMTVVGETDHTGSPVVGQRVESGANRPSGRKHIIDKDDARIVHIERDDGFTDQRQRAALAEVVTVKGDVEFRHPGAPPGQAFKRVAEPFGQRHALLVEADERIIVAAGVAAVLPDGARHPFDRPGDLLRRVESFSERHESLRVK